MTAVAAAVAVEVDETTATAVWPLRWPLDPLLDAAGLGPYALAGRIGTGTDQIRAAREHGLDDIRADRWAIHLGFHPAQIWPGWIDAGHDPVRVTADQPGHTRAAAWLRQRIETGDPAPGERAPSIAGLAAATGVGRAAAARALQILTLEAFLTPGRPGSPRTIAHHQHGHGSGAGAR